VSDEEEMANVILRKLTGFHDGIGLAELLMLLLSEADGNWVVKIGLDRFI
jgi:hypothetical protein